MACRIVVAAMLAMAFACGGSADDGAGSAAAGADAGAYGDLSSISLSQTDVHIPVGVMTAFAVTGTYPDGRRVDVTQQAQATSSDPSIASVAHGQGSQIQITANNPGTATITVTLGSLAQTCKVTVSR
jgi:uncharacterized protein YjdB